MRDKRPNEAKHSQRNQEISIRIIITACLGIACLLALPSFLLSFPSLRRTCGSITIFSLSALLTLRCWFPALFERLKRGAHTRQFYFVAKWALACGFAYAAWIGALLLFAAAKTVPKDVDCTVIVLGCEVYQSGNMSASLRRRSQAALDFLTDHPNAAVVASGGKEDRDPLSEAQAIVQYLVNNGIPKDHIYMDEASVDTKENLANSAKIISENGLAQTVVIVTDDYHEYRAHHYASANGLDAYSAPSKTLWYLAAGYWSREALGVGYYTLFGYK